MGTRKTKLMRGDRYGLLKAAELAAEMIGDYERARDGAHQIRVESPEEAVWDDVHVVRNSHTDKWQVKRLMKDFAHDDAEELIVAASKMTGPTETNLCLGVASLVAITDGKETLCELKDLAALCQEARKPGLQPADFAKTEQGSAAYKFVAGCLQGADATAVLTTLRRLHIREIGLEDKVREEAVAHLRDVFVNAEEVVKQLHAWFQQYPDGSILVDTRLLYEQVVDRYGKRDPARPQWIQLSRTTRQPQWESRGLVALEDLVARAWGTDEPVRLQIAAPPFKGDSASSSLSRLVLHHSSRAATEASHPSEWRSHSLGLCGGTLGAFVEPPEFTCNQLGGTCPHPPRESLSQRNLAERLSDGMNESVWKAYVDSLVRRLQEETIADDLRPAMQSLWAEWHTELEASASHRASFLRSMLATVEEWKRPGFDVAVRAGRLLKDDLARATVPALAIAAAFAAAKISVTLRSDGAAENLQIGGVCAHLVALSAASHPDDRTPWRLSDAPGPMFSLESGVAILGTVDATATELYAVACAESVPFHASDGASQNYRHAGRPYPLLTASPALRAAIRKGMVDVQQHLAEMLGKMNDDRVESLRQAVGASTNG